jgi:hypothetical protein
MDVEESIRNIVDSYLHEHIDHIDEITLKELRQEVDSRLNSDQTKLSKQEYKNLIMESFEESKLQLQTMNEESTESDQHDENINAKTTSWRFTTSETKLIEDICQQYIRASGIEIADLLSFMKDFNDNTKSRSDLWKTLYAALPHRHREAIYRKTRILLTRQLKPVWTKDEKETLMALVS